MKPKCPKCGKPALVATGGFDDPMKPHRFCVYCHKCGWTRRVPPAAIIRLATEPKKPKTCKWKQGGPLGSYSRFCGLVGWYGALVPLYCEGCGKPVEVVNG